jgi:hypothetical protein
MILNINTALEGKVERVIAWFPYEFNAHATLIVRYVGCGIVILLDSGGFKRSRTGGVMGYCRGTGYRVQGGADDSVEYE